MNSTTALQSQLLRLKNENQMLKSEVSSQNKHINELTTHLRTRTASAFVEKIQNQQKPIQQAPEYIQLQSNHEKQLIASKTLTNQLIQAQNEISQKDEKISNLQSQLHSFQKQLKELLENSKKIHALNQQLQSEQIREQQFHTEIDQLTEAFTAVQDQLLTDNDELKLTISSQNQEIQDLKNKIKFAQEQQTAAQQQSELWQQNYQTLLTQFKNSKNVAKTVRFGDKVQEIKWNIQKSNEKQKGSKNLAIESLLQDGEVEMGQSMTDSLKERLNEMLNDGGEEGGENDRNGRQIMKMKENFNKEAKMKQNVEKMPTFRQSQFNELEESDFLALQQSANTEPDVSLSRICNEMLNGDDEELDVEIYELEKSISSLQNLKEKMQ